MIMKRKCNVVNKKVLIGLMCGAMFLAAPQVANAASPEEPGQTGQPSLKSNVALNIGTEALIVDITVPGTISFAFNADGSNDIPDNFIITNHNKIASFYLKDVNVNAGESGWKIASSDEKIPMDEKTIMLKMGMKNAEKEIVPTNGTKDSIGAVSYTSSEFLLKPEVDTQMSFVVNRPIYTEQIKQTKAFDMDMNFEMI